MPTFGDIISEKRRELGISQKDLATRILKEDGTPISPQYLNDLEHDRRHPPSEHFIQQFSECLSISSDQLYYSAGELAPDMKDLNVNEEIVSEAYTAFRRTIKGNE